MKRKRVIRPLHREIEKHTVLTFAEAAEISGLSVAGVKKAARQGKFGNQAGGVFAAQLDDWLKMQFITYMVEALDRYGFAPEAVVQIKAAVNAHLERQKT